MYERTIQQHLTMQMSRYPAVTVMGPRQSGKTTLVRETYPDFEYVLFEDRDTLEFAKNDPRGFLDRYNDPVIFDEIQNSPDIISYLQGEIDNKKTNGHYILSGSHQFSLNEKISQSLAGRTAILRLLPLSLAELNSRTTQTYWLDGKLNQSISQPTHSVYEHIIKGMYPRLHKNNIPPYPFYRDYVETYVTRDLRQLLEVTNLNRFQTFLRLAAGRSGQLLDLSNLADAAGVDHSTARRWISVLEASYVIYLLQPHHKNFNKRLIKSPKLFFLDSGLLCYLLRIRNVTDLETHPLIGSIFETFIFTELYKNFLNADEEAPLYFWRDYSKKEIDFMIDRGQTLLPIEVKSGKTISSNYLNTLQYWLNLKDNPQETGCLIYGGNDWIIRKKIQTIPWYAVS